ncbi:MAG: hypothetical protein GX372_05025 [Ignavibacteria bacterium]|jgi:hypothetical protein|nr:hypothetical protein [Ignavibacteria bacterium]
MDTIYLKIKAKKTDGNLEEIRKEGLLFDTISDVLDIDRNSVVEIDESNYKKEVNNIISRFSKYDKS